MINTCINIADISTLSENVKTSSVSVELSFFIPIGMKEISEPEGSESVFVTLNHFFEFLISEIQSIHYY